MTGSGEWADRYTDFCKRGEVGSDGGYGMKGKSPIRYAGRRK
jgi:hypothetical protein